MVSLNVVPDDECRPCKLLSLMMTLLMTPVSLNVVPVDDEVEVFETDQDLVSFALQSGPIKF